MSLSFFRSAHVIALATFVTSMISFGCGGSSPVVDPDTARQIEQGAIVGSSMREGRVDAWRGLPFAKAPVGALRWRAPDPPDSWEETREALASGSACPQLGGDPILGDEDCLYLDVFAPATARDAVSDPSRRLPVMFWIHGGGNAMGSGSQLDPSRLAAENDVIIVTINYRLGILGWLSHPGLRSTARDADDASGNFGTLDIIRALEWVQVNAAAFGGDPNNVTVFGESAGALNVFSLLVSPRAKGLFHGAISESGSPVSMTRIQSENYTDAADEGLPGSSGEIILALLAADGRASSRKDAKRLAAAMSDAEVDAFLRGFSMDELMAPFVDAAADSSMPIYITPNILRDGHVIPDADVLEILGTPGAYNEVPFIAGTNREESKLFFVMTSPHVSRRFGFPTGLTDERRYDLEGEYGGLVWRAQGVDEPVSAMRRVQGPTVWGYRFDWDEEPTVLGVDLSKLIGAGHGIDLIFVFGLTDLGFADRFLFDDVESASELSARMRSYWTNFAHTKRPGRGQDGDLPEWKAWGTETGVPRYMVLDSARDGGLSMESDEIDLAAVLNKASSDSRLLNGEERCAIYRNMVQWSTALTVSEYDRIDEGICRAYPLESRLFFPSLSHDNNPPTGTN